MDAVEDYLESCAQVRVDIEVVESLQRSENLEVSLKYVLKHATGRGSNIFQLSDTSEKKPNHFVASRKRWLESQGRNGALQESGQNEWHDIEYHAARAKAPGVPRQNPISAFASAKLVVSQRRRRPFGLDGRKTDDGEVLLSRNWQRAC